MESLQNLHAFVTGGGRGIGAAIAAALTDAGAAVTIAGRNTEVLEAQVAAGRAAGWVQADVTDAEAVRRAVGEAEAARGPIAILVNNAGGALTAPFLRTDADAFRSMYELNVLGPVHAIQAVLPGMTERRFGRIVNVASTAALKGYAYVSAYVAAKHAILGLTRSVALEVAVTGVTVNAVCPGFTDTDLVSASVERIVEKTGRTADAARADLARNNPQRRLIDPKEVAAAVVFLSGPGAGSVNGTTLTVAGGEI